MAFLVHRLDSIYPKKGNHEELADTGIVIVQSTSGNTRPCSKKNILKKKAK